MRQTINRDLLAAIAPTGKWATIADDKLRGFCVKVSPSGTVTFYYRWDKPRTASGKRQQGRKLIGTYPAMKCADARQIAQEHAATLERVTDDAETVIVKRARRAATVERARIAPLVSAFLSEIYEPYFTVKSKNKDRAKRTIADIRAHFSEFMDRPLDRVTGEDLRDWKTRELARNKPSTANRKLNAFRGLLREAHARKVIAENPARGIGKEDEGSGVVRWMKPDEEARVRAALDAREAMHRERHEWINANPRRNAVFAPHHAYTDIVKPAVILAPNTGLRRNEQFTLRWDDIDLTARTVTVRSANAKTNRTRVVPLCNEAHDVLTAWRAQCFQDNVIPLYVFPDAVGGVLSRGITQQWNEVMRTAKVAGLRWHDLRHSFATRAVEQGVPLDLLSRWLGHSKLEQTMRYAHRSPEFTTSAIAALDRARAAALAYAQQDAAQAA